MYAVGLVIIGIERIPPLVIINKVDIQLLCHLPEKLIVVRNINCIRLAVMGFLLNGKDASDKYLRIRKLFLETLDAVLISAYEIYRILFFIKFILTVMKDQVPGIGFHDLISYAAKVPRVCADLSEDLVIIENAVFGYGFYQTVTRYDDVIECRPVVAALYLVELRRLSRSRDFRRLFF